MTGDSQKNGDMPNLEVGQACHIGMVRSLNEDRILALNLSPSGMSTEKTLALFAVADGIGGCEGGEIASDLVLKAMSEGILDSLAVPVTEEKLAGFDQERLLMVLTGGVKKANRMVFDQSQVRGNGMGTTLVAALISVSSAHIANVGDSRAYLLEGGNLRQVTNDHSLVAGLVSAGFITRDEVYTHPQRNIITRSVGMGPDVEVDLFTEELHPGSSLVLCSDGLWEMVKDDHIRSILLESPHSQVACDQLVEVANQNGGTDNISVIVIRRRSSVEDH